MKTFGTYYHRNRNAITQAFSVMLAALLLYSSHSFSFWSKDEDRQVQVSSDLATPVMEAGRVQNAFIKISLTGFEQEGDEQRTPANVALVLDKSGSMSGQKIEQAREAAVMAIQRLNSDDIVSVVTYDDTVHVVVPATKAQDKQAISKKIRSIRSGGSTALFAGVSKGAQELRKFISENRVNRVILLSDGLANVGPQSASELGQLGMSLGKEGISVTTIGLGLGYNEDLMTQLAGYSDGNHAFVENAQDLARIFQYEFGDVLSVVAQGVDIQIDCADGVKPLRILGRNSRIDGNRVHTRLNQLYSEQEKYIILEVEVPASQAGSERELADVKVSYNNLALNKVETKRNQVNVSFSQSQEEIKDNLNKVVYEDSVEQVVNEDSKKAIKLRDKGDVSGARELLQNSASMLGSMAAEFDSSRLKKQEEEILEDAELLEEENWNRNRKELKAKQYKKSSQQSY